MDLIRFDNKYYFNKRNRIMRLAGLLVMLFCLVFSSFVYAEFYRYKDKDGVIRYTDDLSLVPEEQREKTEIYESVAPKSGSDEDAVAKEGEKTGGNSDIETDEIDVPEGKDVAQLEKMNKKKAELDKEYADLVKEKDELVKSKEGIKKDSELKAYNEKIVELNDRISAFEKKRKEFAKEVDAFNARFKQ
jgi:hypothetical protein